MPILLYHHINSHQNHEQIKQSINYKYILRMEVTKVSELTATAVSIVLYMSNQYHNKASQQQIIISLRRGRSSDPRRNSGPQGLAIAIDVDSTRGGGRSSILSIPVQLPLLRSGHHQEKLSWSSMSKYKRRSVSVHNIFNVMFINDIHGRTS